MWPIMFRGSDVWMHVCVFQRHSEAEKAMEQVLKLDSQCKEASSELFNCRVLQLMVSNTSNGHALI